MNIEKIENTFRVSNDSNELFDAFHSAIEQGIKDIDLYKILLGNPVLSLDELSMYIEKLITVIPHKAFEMLLWSGELFSIRSDKIDSIEKSLKYFGRAATIISNHYLPYQRAINLYNYEIDLSVNQHIIKFIEDGIQVVNKKSILHKVLAKHYKKLGNIDLAKEYERLAEKAAQRE